ncbi:MAG: hypothetical protein LC780_16390 [Acidobacteria bacterium]|nr:hypothetical protein [Acidobacteriota bacterium]
MRDPLPRVPPDSVDRGRPVTLAALFAFAALTTGVSAQTFTEYPVPTTDSQMLGITGGSDGNIWFTEQLGKKIGRITPAGVITEFTIPGTLDSPKQITAGPDGNVWFSDFISVGRVTPSGDITRFQIPSSSLPEGITSGPDGNIWVTLSSRDFQIARVTTNGAITEFAVPGVVQLHAITSGPDGNLWFTDPNGNHIGRITTAGSVTLFSTPQEVTGPYEIVSGPDGNLWFTSAFHIGRITTAGVITLFPDFGGDFPRGIAAGPDGNVWYTESVGNNIGRIGMDGRMAEFRPPTALAGPLDIAAGSDGAMWFIESGKNKIGRITTGPCTPGPTSLCLNDGRFQVDVAWRAPAQGTSGVGIPVRLTADTGSFWFFSSSNVELVIKVVNGLAVNSRYWVFYGALSDVEYTITVRDAATGAVKTYVNPSGRLASVADTDAFPAVAFQAAGKQTEAVLPAAESAPDAPVRVRDLAQSSGSSTARFPMSSTRSR